MKMSYLRNLNKIFILSFLLKSFYQLSVCEYVCPNHLFLADVVTECFTEYGIIDIHYLIASIISETNAKI